MKKNWIFKFKNAKDIIKEVKIQFAFLMNEGLELKKLFRNKISAKILRYPEKVIRIAVEKPKAWEYLLFVEALEYNLQKQQDLEQDLFYGMYLDENILLTNPQEILDLCRSRLSELQNKVNLLKILLTQGFKDAVEIHREPDRILYIAERTIDIYKAIGEWKLNFKKYMFPIEYRGLWEAMTRWGNSIIIGIEAFIPMAREKLKLTLSQQENEIELTMPIELNEDLTKEVNTEIEKLICVLKKQVEERTCKGIEDDN